MTTRFVTPGNRAFVPLTWVVLSALVAGNLVDSVRGDQVIMQNADRYNGKVLSVGTNVVVLQSDVLGNVNLPRSKVINIAFGSNAAASSSPAALPVRAAPLPQTNAATDLSATLQQLGAQSNLIQQVQAQFLGTAGPEANDKFNELLTGLTTGKMDINGLRAEAKSAADQLRSLEKESGGDPSGTMEMYLSVLDSFLQESAPANAPTNAARALSKPASPSARNQ